MTTPKIIPFLNGPFSQWHISNFTIDGIKYCCCEQYMMAQKAKLFEDDITYKRIMMTNNPAEHKALGKLVKGFNDKTWKKYRYFIVYNGNYAKFSQNEELQKKLLATENNILCEANPKDAIWGVALKIHDPKIKDPKCWKGLNLLGQALMEVRDKLKKEKPLLAKPIKKT